MAIGNLLKSNNVYKKCCSISLFFISNIPSLILYAVIKGLPIYPNCTESYERSCTIYRMKQNATKCDKNLAECKMPY